MVGADTVTVTAVEDALYYKDRPPGQILREDVPDEEYFAGCVDRIVQVLRESSYSDKDKLNLIANIVGV